MQARETNVEWCEGFTHAFAVVPWCAEFANTVSNLSFVAVACIGWRRCLRQALPASFKYTETVIFFVAVASALFHTTQDPRAEFLDEMSMTLLGTGYLLVLRNRHACTRELNAWRGLCLAYALLVGTAWVLYVYRGWYEVFKTCFTVQVVIPAGVSFVAAPAGAKQWWWAFLLCIAVGKLAWEVEQGLYRSGHCPSSMQHAAFWLHPAWHACSAAAHACWMQHVSVIPVLKGRSHRD